MSLHLRMILILGGRSFFALTAAAFVISMIIYVLYQETTKEKLVAFRKMLLVFIVLFVVGMIVYTVYKEEITNILNQHIYFIRISYDQYSRITGFIFLF